MCSDQHARACVCMCAHVHVRARRMCVRARVRAFEHYREDWLGHLRMDGIHKSRGPQVSHADKRLEIIIICSTPSVHNHLVKHASGHMLVVLIPPCMPLKPKLIAIGVHFRRNHVSAPRLSALLSIFGS